LYNIQRGSGVEQTISLAHNLASSDNNYINASAHVILIAEAQSIILVVTLIEKDLNQQYHQ